MDVFATYWQHLTWIVEWDNAGISGGRGEGYGKIGNCSNTTYMYFTYWESDWKHMTVLFINDVDNIIVHVEEFSLVISLENALYLKNSLC